jgi:hypothetical protein
VRDVSASVPSSASVKCERGGIGWVGVPVSIQRRRNRDGYETMGRKEAGLREGGRRTRQRSTHPIQYPQCPRRVARVDPVQRELYVSKINESLLRLYELKSESPPAGSFHRRV